MRRTLILQEEPIDEATLTEARLFDEGRGTGAVIYFLGVVRGQENDKMIKGLHYEAFAEMVERQFELIFDHVERTWPIQSIRLIHRTGPVQVSEASLWIEVMAGHRGEAFEACQWVIDEMKRVVPIWKQPYGLTD